MSDKKKSRLIIGSDGVYKIIEEPSEGKTQVKISSYLKYLRRLDDKK